LARCIVPALVVILYGGATVQMIGWAFGLCSWPEMFGFTEFLAFMLATGVSVRSLLDRWRDE
jgi:hypothetical protein